MKKFVLILTIAGLSLLFSGCGKKEETPETSVKEEMKSAKENLGEAASDFKKAADETAREVGSAAKDFGSRIGGVFKKAKDDLSD